MGNSRADIFTSLALEAAPGFGVGRCSAAYAEPLDVSYLDSVDVRVEVCREPT